MVDIETIVSFKMREVCMKRVLLLSTLYLSLQADMEYTLEKQAYSREKYFIKIAACSALASAQKIQAKAPFETDIIYMDKYHSLVSPELKDKEQAKKYLKIVRKKFSDAYLITLYKKETLLKPLPQEKVRKISRLGKAVLLYQHKKYEEALMAFDRIMIESPDDMAAKSYYAKTLYQLGLFVEAENEFKELLNTRLDTQSKREVKKYLASIERKKKRHFYTAEVGVGIGYDDNIDLTTDASTTQYGRFTLINDTNKTSSTFGLATLKLTHRYKRENFDIYSSIYSYNEFAHSAKGNDLNYLDISSGILKRVKNFSIMIPVGFNTSYLEGEDIGYNFYTSPTLTYNNSKHLRTFAQFTYSDNTTKFAEHRDYTMMGAGLGVKYAKNKFQGSLSLSGQKVSAKEDLRYDVSKDVKSLMMQSKYYLFTSLYLAADLILLKDAYSELDEVMGYKREDEMLSLGLSIGKNISKNALLRMRYTHSENESNINAYSYEKNGYTCEFKYKF